MAKIVCEHVGKMYPGDVEAVKDFHLDVEDGEFLVLVGPSGCGKSTMLRMIAGLEDITDGEIYIGETPVSRLKPSKRDIAMVFQNYALYPHMTIYQNLSFSLALQGMKRKEIHERVLEAADILGLNDLLRRRPGQISGGQAQRVALGRAIVRRPKVFLMDEPLSNLDAKMRISMRTEISRLHKRIQTTFVYVTHDQTEAMTMGDRIVVMDQGEIQQAARPTEIYACPSNRFVGEFIGSPKMNVLPAELAFDGGTPQAIVGDYRLDLSGRDLDFLAEDTRVLLGIRPGGISFAEGEGLPVVAELREYHGDDAFLHLRTEDDEEIVAQVPVEHPFESGQSLRARFAPEEVHVFDADTGRRL